MTENVEKKTKPCPNCKENIAEGAKKCPKCHSDLRNWFVRHKIITGFIILILFAGVLGAFADDTPTQDTQVNNEPTNTDQTIQEEDDQPSVPAEYRSALNKATSYANTQNMSKQGVYDQLVSEYGERFSIEAAQYAIDNVKADWNANALAKATSYANTQHMSKQGVYDQLVSEYGEKFLAAEAQYAIDNVQANWNENALAKAKSYQETQNMSPAAIHDQLTSEYGEKYTESEADYAIAHLND